MQQCMKIALSCRRPFVTSMITTSKDMLEPGGMLMPDRVAKSPNILRYHGNKGLADQSNRYHACMVGIRLGKHARCTNP